MSKARIRRRLLAARRYDVRICKHIDESRDYLGGRRRYAWISPALMRLASRVPVRRQWFPPQG